MNKKGLLLLVIELIVRVTKKRCNRYVHGTVIAYGINLGSSLSRQYRPLSRERCADYKTPRKLAGIENTYSILGKTRRG